MAFFRQAGDEALAHSAHREAVAAFEQVLGALRHFPERPDTLAQAIDLRLALRNALWPLGELRQILVCLQEVLPLAEVLGDQYRLEWIAVYLAGQFGQICEPDQALAAGQRALGMAAELGDIDLEVAAHRTPPHAEQAEAYYREALALADELGMRPLVAHCHCGLGTLYGKTGQLELACAELSTAIALYRAMDMTFWLPQAEVALAHMVAAPARRAGRGVRRWLAQQ